VLLSLLLAAGLVLVRIAALATAGL
jgi:hypothetical protein